MEWCRIIFLQIPLDIFHIRRTDSINCAVFLSCLITFTCDQQHRRPLTFKDRLMNGHTSVFNNLIWTILLRHILSNIFRYLLHRLLAGILCHKIYLLRILSRNKTQIPATDISFKLYQVSGTTDINVNIIKYILIF